MWNTHCFAAVLTAAAILGQSAALADTNPDSDPVIDVQRHAGMVIVDVSMFVRAPQQQAWAVLTDYDHMADFFPDLHSSKVIKKADGKTTIEQKGVVSYGPFSVPFDVVREIEFKPYAEIRSRAVSGSVKNGTAVTKLIPEANGTKITYHSEAEPNVWVPPGVGPKFIESETHAQFESLRTEILKRSDSDRHS